MKPKTYPESIVGHELQFIRDYLLNELGHLKAPALNGTPSRLQEQLKVIGLTSDNLSEHVYWRVHELSSYPKRCASCGNLITKFHSFSRGYPHARCSTKCSNGDKSVQEKKKTTSLEKFGTEFPWQNQLIKDKARQTFVDGWFERRFSQFLPEYVPLTTREEYAGAKTKFRWKHECGHEFEELMSWASVKPMCPACREHLNLSRPQRDIMEFVKSIFTGIVVSNDRRTIYPLELDIYLPEKKIAIEYNSATYHSYDKLETPEQKNYHRRKADVCAQRGIKLIQIWEHEWSKQREIVNSRLKSALGVDRKIYARKCSIKEVASLESMKFQADTHIQGAIGARVKLGLYHENQLVALMTFGKPRFSKKYEWELIRYCSVGTIVGGASKLFKRFIKDYSPKSIVSYADRRWSTGHLYEVLGFINTSATPPNYCYFKNGKRFLRYAFQKHKLATFMEHFDADKSESENAFSHGYRRAWDAGSYLMVWLSEGKS